MPSTKNLTQKSYQTHTVSNVKVWANSILFAVVLVIAVFFTIWGFALLKKSELIEVGYDAKVVGLTCYAHVGEQWLHCDYASKVYVKPKEEPPPDTFGVVPKSTITDILRKNKVKNGANDH